MSPSPASYFFIFFLLETQEVFDHLASFVKHKERISRSGIKLSAASYNLGPFPLSSDNLGSSWTKVQSVTCCDLSTCLLLQLNIPINEGGTPLSHEHNLTEPSELLRVKVAPE